MQVGALKNTDKLHACGLPFSVFRKSLSFSRQRAVRCEISTQVLDSVLYVVPYIYIYGLYVVQSHSKEQLHETIEEQLCINMCIYII